MKIFVNVIRDDHGNYPGGLANRQATERYLTSVFREANRLWAQGLIELRRKGTIYRQSSKYFTMKNDVFQLALKSGWRQSGHINLFFVDSIHGVLGMQVPCSGKMIILAYNDVAPAGNTLAHEAGHFLSLSHDSAQRDRTNIMQGPGKSSGWWVERNEFSPKQIEDCHERLSKHVTKKKVREP